MSDIASQTKLQWDPKTLDKFNRMITKIPIFHRDIALKVVVKKAEMNASERGSALIEEPDIIRAFYSEVPFAFYSLMVRLLDELKFDYKKYEPK